MTLRYINLWLTLTLTYTKFEHFVVIRFWVMLPLLVWKMQLLTLWPWPLTFQHQIDVTSSISQAHFLYKVWKLWDHSFLVMLRTIRQTDRIDRHLNRRTRISYPLRPTKWVIYSVLFCTATTSFQLWWEADVEITNERLLHIPTYT